MEKEHLIASNELDKLVYNIFHDIDVNNESDNELNVMNTDTVVDSGDEMKDFDTLSEASSSSSSDESSGNYKRQKMNDDSRSLVSKNDKLKPKDSQKKSNIREKSSYKTKGSPSIKAVETKRDDSEKKDSVKRKINSRKKNNSTGEEESSSQSYIKKLNFLFRDARFFVIKSNNTENIDIAKDKGVWSTLPRNENKLSEAFKSSQNVILIFSARESGKFAGFARIALNVDYTIPPVPWVVPRRLKESNIFGGTFTIDWICKKELPFSCTSTFRNPWNEGKPVKIARDGQEVEPTVAEELCRLFPQDDDIDIIPILRKSKEAVVEENSDKHMFQNPLTANRNDSRKRFKRSHDAHRSTDTRNKLFVKNRVKGDNSSYQRWRENANSLTSIHMNNFMHNIRPPLRGAFIPPHKMFPFMPPPPPPGYFAMMSHNFPRPPMLQNYSRFPVEVRNEHHGSKRYNDKGSERSKERSFRR